MGKAAPRVRYEPGPAFEEVKEEAMLDISSTDSTEFWLIQWPKDQIDLLDFHGKELSLKLQSDGTLGSLESSSGESYELVSFAAQKPDATVFLPSGSETKPVGKISRRVSLVRYPEPEELTKPSFGSVTPRSKKSAGSKKTMSRFTSASKNRSSQGSALSLGQRSAEPTPKHKGKRKDESSQGHSNVSGKTSHGSQEGSALSLGQRSAEPTPKHKGKKKDESSQGHSNVSGKASQGSQAVGEGSNMASEMPQSPSEKSQKKRKKVKIVE